MVTNFIILFFFVIINFEMSETRENQVSKKISRAGGKSKTKNNGSIPHGRDEVKKAILDAAEQLLVTKSANKISVREIADLAQTKHPLIYRYFGTKAEVIRAAHARGIEKIETVVNKIDTLQENAGFIFEAVKKNKFRQIALSRAMIDGVDLRLVQTQYPVMNHLLGLLKKRNEEAAPDSKFDPQLMTAVLAATSLGWFLYEPFLLAATDMENKNKEELHKEVIKVLEEIIRKLC